MRILDSRRLTGPSLLLDRPGAILDIALEGEDAERAQMAWFQALVALLECVDGAGASLHRVPAAARPHRDGLSVAFTAEPDVLYTATEINEEAFRWAAEALERGARRLEKPPLQEAVERLGAALERERKPWLRELAAEASRRRVTLLADDKRVSVGLGAGSRAWPIEESPRALARIPWKKLHDIPLALVTGTNGKTTSVRLLAEMVTAAGRVAGATSTDAVTVGGEVVAVGDYSGPNGARSVLRDRRVEVAILEVARGGILRRGLAVPHARAALVTNVASDHLGEYGIDDLDALADVKMVVAKAVPADGRVVLNADDERLWRRGAALETPVIWFTLDEVDHEVAAHRRRGGEACVIEGGVLTFARGSEKIPVTAVDEIPIAFGGAARHNVANALGAIGVAMALGLPVEAIREGLRRFEPTPAANPGRVNVWRLGGVTAIVDFAHNPHGLAALARMTGALPASRRTLVIGQAGDRDDDAIRELVREAWRMAPDHVFIKEMETYLRGRERGVVPAVIETELLRLGARSDSLSRWPTELDAVRAALAWARDGDLLVLTTHAQRDEVIGLLQRLVERAWRPGQALPEALPID